MTATLLDGKLVAKYVKEEVREKTDRLVKHGTKPFLATIQVGDDPASTSYLKGKHKAAAEVGIETVHHHLVTDTTHEQLVRLITELNMNSKVHGILVQLPLPDELDEQDVVEKIIPYKDVDGLHPINIGKLAAGIEQLVPCTPKGIIRLLDYYHVPAAGSNVVIINRTTLVGRPLANLFLNRDATVTVCHSKTKNLEKITHNADILVVAVGRESFQLGKDYVKKGATVVDVGLTRVQDRLRGDVDFDEVSKVADYITPVPGGVGPMTVASLLENTVIAAENIGMHISMHR